jgi:hypothetical protein
MQCWCRRRFASLSRGCDFQVPKISGFILTSRTRQGPLLTSVSFHIPKGYPELLAPTLIDAER